MSIRHLESLFRPASIAVVGASDRAGSVGAVVWRNLRSGGFQGPIRAVNSAHAQVGGERAWPDVASLPEAPELAVICTPAATVPSIVAALGRRGTRAAIVLGAGLRAPGPQGGTTLEQAMLQAARPHLLRILGPNCIGVLVPGIGLNASFAPAAALAGNLAFVTQSGALATAMLDWANGRGIGFSHFVSLGDGADVDFGDMLDYLASDAGTRAILMYAESFSSARKFMSAARAASRNKPVIVVKAGRAPAGARAAASHTGALAGSDAVIDAALRRAGMLRVDALEDLFDAAQTLARARVPQGDRLAIVTNGGGAGVLAADALALAGGRLADLAPSTRAALDACLPATWSQGNPVDIIGDAPALRYRDALRVLLRAPEVDGVLFMHAPTAIVGAREIADACLQDMRDCAKPVLSCWLGGAAVADARAACSRAAVASLDTPERAVSAWLQLAQYAANQRALRQLPDARSDAFVPRRDDALAVLQLAAQEGRDWLSPVEAVQVLDAYGLSSLPTLEVRDEEAAAAAAERIGFPVALKIRSPQALHKSDVGGVALALGDAAAVRSRAMLMREGLLALLPDAQVDGFTVQAMARRPHARELIVGIACDPVFGPVVLFGEGGTMVELRPAHAIALPPLNAELARDLVLRSGCARLLGPLRGRPAVNERALLDTLQRVARMAAELAPLAELDVNPLLADEEGVLAVDARMRVHRSRTRVPPTAICAYRTELEESIETPAGKPLRLRPIRPEDGERLAAFYSAASPQDMRLRFFFSRREVLHSELARYCQIDYDREMAFIALDDGDPAGPPTMVGEVRAVADPDNRQAEFAVQVAGSWQHQGLGRILLRKLIAYQRTRGTHELVGYCLHGNTAMLALAQALGFQVQAQAGTDVLRLSLGSAGPAGAGEAVRGPGWI